MTEQALFLTTKTTQIVRPFSQFISR